MNTPEPIAYDAGGAPMYAQATTASGGLIVSSRPPEVYTDAEMDAAADAAAADPGPPAEVWTDVDLDAAAAHEHEPEAG